MEKVFSADKVELNIGDEIYYICGDNKKVTSELSKNNKFNYKEQSWLFPKPVSLVSYTVKKAKVRGFVVKEINKEQKYFIAIDNPRYDFLGGMFDAILNSYKTEDRDNENDNQGPYLYINPELICCEESEANKLCNGCLDYAKDKMIDCIKDFFDIQKKEL